MNQAAPRVVGDGLEHVNQGFVLLVVPDAGRQGTGCKGSVEPVNVLMAPVVARIQLVYLVLYQSMCEKRTAAQQGRSARGVHCNSYEKYHFLPTIVLLVCQPGTVQRGDKADAFGIDLSSLFSTADRYIVTWLSSHLMIGLKLTPTPPKGQGCARLGHMAHLPPCGCYAGTNSTKAT